MIRKLKTLVLGCCLALLGVGTAQAARLTCDAPAPMVGTRASAPLAASDSYFKDADGRVVILRGVNATGNAKVPPFESIRTPEQLDPLQGWGLNTLRLLFNWEAYEPAPCQYNQAYLDHYEQIIRWAEERNIYVIVDFHQDAFSRFSIDGCGEGFPSWAVTEQVQLKRPDNGANCSGWGFKMLFDLSHHKTWSVFHSDLEGAKTRYVAMTRNVAARMAARPNVVGYEVINEPWGNDAELLKLYEQVGVAVRSVHPEAIVFIPPHALVSGGTSADNIPAPNLGNTAYSPHYYDATVLIFGGWWGSSPNGVLNTFLKKAQSRRAPMLLGEFGGPANANNIGNYMEAMYTWLDANLVSSTQWVYSPDWRPDSKDGWNAEDLSIVDGANHLRTQLYTPRPYPQKTAGTAIRFARTSNGFTHAWTQNAKGQTEIFIPASWGAKLKIRVTPATAQCALNKQLLTCTASPSSQVTVTATQ